MGWKVGGTAGMLATRLPLPLTSNPKPARSCVCLPALGMPCLVFLNQAAGALCRRAPSTLHAVAITAATAYLFIVSPVFSKDHVSHRLAHAWPQRSLFCSCVASRAGVWVEQLQ